MAEQQNGTDRVGSVADETARLVEALSGWAQGAYAAAVQDAPPPTDPGTAPDSAADPAPAAGPAAEAPSPGAPAPGGSGASGASGGSCSNCGARTGVGQAAACGVCPVCQGIAFLRGVRPETVQRLADLAGALAATLREVAADRSRAASPPTPAGAPGRASTGSTTSRVQDITVADQDDPQPSQRSQPTQRSQPDHTDRPDQIDHTAAESAFDRPATTGSARP